MADPYVGEIRMMPYTFAPRDWAWCEGQTTPIYQQTTLYAVIGNAYGGDGRTTFALPNLSDRAPINQGQAPGLSQYSVGDRTGDHLIELNNTEIPSHTHTLSVCKQTFAETTQPSPSVLPQTLLTNTTTPHQSVYKQEPPPPATIAKTDMAFEACSITGNSLGHENRQPFLCVNFCIALEGMYPPRP